MRLRISRAIAVCLLIGASHAQAQEAPAPHSQYYPVATTYGIASLQPPANSAPAVTPAITVEDWKAIVERLNRAEAELQSLRDAKALNNAGSSPLDFGEPSSSAAMGPIPD